MPGQNSNGAHRDIGDLDKPTSLVTGRRTAWGRKNTIKSCSRAYRNCATSYLFNSNPTIATPTAATNHISATLLVAVMALPATTGPTTALRE